MILEESSQGRSQKFVSEGDKTGGLGTEVPSGLQGQSPGGVPQKLIEDIYYANANNHCNKPNVLTKNH